MSQAPAAEPDFDAVHGAPARAAQGAAGGLFAELDAEAAMVADRITPAKRGAGRPPGTPNRSTTMMKQYLLAKGYRDPLEGLAALASGDPIEIMEALGLNASNEGAPAFALEVMKLQLRAREALLPYFHQAMPKAVEIKSEGPRTLIVINDKAEQSQRFTVIDATTSHEVTSHDDAKNDADQ